MPAMNEVGRIVDQLEREHAGDPWHGSPLSTILDGVTWQQAAAKPLADAHVGLALLATRLDDVNSARQSYKQALQLDPMNMAALTNLALIERAAGNASAANEYLQQTLRIHPK